MPRKAFVADLNAAGAISNFGQISNVRAGDDDGEFNFTFGGSTISALVPDLGDYPSSHAYHIFASDDASPAIAQAISTFVAPGLPIQELLNELSAYLTHKTSNHISKGKSKGNGTQAAPLMIDDSDQDEDEDEEMMDDVDETSPLSDEEEEEPSFWLDDEDLAYGGPAQSFDGAGHTELGPVALAQARADLRAAKAAGFRVGVTGRGGSRVLAGNCYVSVGIRVAKLGLSEEALTAWSLDGEMKNQYLVLLLHYPSGYRPLADLLQQSTSTKQLLAMRTVICKSYKPHSLEDAQAMFKVDSSTEQGKSSNTKSCKKTFISASLDDLLNDRLLPLIGYRLKFAFGWGGAEHYYNSHLGRTDAGSVQYEESYAEDKRSRKVMNMESPLLRNDALGDGTPLQNLSLPTVAAQFLLRHFVNCTKFCLVCFSPLTTTVEMLKPYVCDQSLCLYQYMALGMGPEIEHEILESPLVCDLLVSFAYSAIKKRMLPKELFPTGLALSVPHPSRPYNGWSGKSASSSHQYYHQPTAHVDNPSTLQTGDGIHAAKVDRSRLELLFDAGQVCPVVKGSWIVINVKPDNDENPAWYSRVTDTTYFPTVSISDPIHAAVATEEKTAKTTTTSSPKGFPTGFADCEFHIFDQNLDDFSSMTDKYIALQLLLDLLPSVTEMREYLMHQGSSLRNWLKMPNASLGVLRWIIASNRSCIRAVDIPEKEGGAAQPSVKEPRVQGLEKLLQFRFASGAPDKEHTFMEAIQKETRSLEHPTMFAWHGSDLGNWHSIVRQGLHFNKITNGRAYGNGVYMAKDFHTSNGYSSRGGATWPRSQLEVQNAVALMEVINAPSKFVSAGNPYYVVSQIEWLQTRYLMVQSRRPDITLVADDAVTNNARAILPQDPTRTPTGSNNKSITIPLTAIPRSRRPRNARHVATSVIEVEDDDDAVSVATLDEDNDALVDKVMTAQVHSTVPMKRKADLTVLPFTPTDLSNLVMTTPPAYAATSTTRRLMKDFRLLIETQESYMNSNALSELGWYVNPETENMYQWMIELHSFPKDLPLAKDMIKAKVQSVVLEMRFGQSYPMSPPFVRVIRPRFLPFANGGGGHVTAGGSICMDLLTNSGWSAVSTIESVLLQIRMAIMSTEPRAARLQGSGDYGVGEAVDAFKRACAVHGWEVPKEMTQIAYAGSSK